ncbi:MAG: hypothetical protein AAFU69_11535, partial [Pseudomonadota bacterium]
MFFILPPIVNLLFLFAPIIWFRIDDFAKFKSSEEEELIAFLVRSSIGRKYHFKNYILLKAHIASVTKRGAAPKVCLPLSPPPPAITN